jgi:hypothetical protein
MRASLFCLVLIAAQLSSSLAQLNSSQEVVRLPSHVGTISPSHGGKLVQLLNAPSSIFLPSQPPQTDSQAHPWHVDIKNLGPGNVTVQDHSHFAVLLHPNQLVHIHVMGNTYSVGN